AGRPPAVRAGAWHGHRRGKRVGNVTRAEGSESTTPGAGRAQARIAGLTVAALGTHLALRCTARTTSPAGGLRVDQLPLLAALVLGGGSLVLELLRKVLRREFGSDLLAGISIVTSALLGEYLAGSLVVLMLSGGEALEAYAVRNASSVLAALARPVPSLAHRPRDGPV